MQASASIKLVTLFNQILQQQLPTDVWLWLNERSLAIQTETNASVLNSTFALVPRKSGRLVCQLPADADSFVNETISNFSIEGWTIDQLCRAYILLHVATTDEEIYCRKIETLFKTAEMNELVSLYASLPLLAYPNYWVAQCTEGIRSNIGTVLEAIMYNNPYPKNYLDESAWNQMILKAFFTDKDINSIVGIDERNNADLAETLLAYASERRAAGRSINPQLWRFTAPFVNEHAIKNLEALLKSNDPVEVNAAALVCFATPYQPANHLLNNQSHLLQKIKTGSLTWKTIYDN